MRKITLLAVAVFLVLPCTAALAYSGAIFTTDVSCGSTNLNLYNDKDEVYLNGGPAHPGAAGLPDGSYFVEVTEPDGTLLGRSATAVVHVTDGLFDQCYHLLEICLTTSSSYTVAGYDTSSNPGGEYKVLVSPDINFTGGTTKEDNFKVQSTPGSESAQIGADKFYDANANGAWDAGEVEIPGWKVCIQELPAGTPDCNHATPLTVSVTPGSYLMVEGTPVGSSWIHTTPISVTLTVADGESKEADFGNVCLGSGGGLTLGFWSNKNGGALFNTADLALMLGLNLRAGSGANFDPNNYAGFRTWILSATATNMAYMLSAQLAAMELNVAHGKVSGGALVYAPCLIGTDTPGANALGFISVTDLMAAANTSLGFNGFTPSGDPNRTYQECLKTTLDSANNNLNFVQGSPCPFSF